MSTETSKSSTTTSIEKSETVTSEAKEETKVLTAEINGNQHRYTITTKGDKVQKLKLDVLSALPEKIATNSANLSPEEMTKIINEGLQSDSEYKALRAAEPPGSAPFFRMQGYRHLFLLPQFMKEGLYWKI